MFFVKTCYFPLPLYCISMYYRGGKFYFRTLYNIYQHLPYVKSRCHCVYVFFVKSCPLISLYRRPLFYCKKFAMSRFLPRYSIYRWKKMNKLEWENSGRGFIKPGLSVTYIITHNFVTSLRPYCILPRVLHRPPIFTLLAILTV